MGECLALQENAPVLQTDIFMTKCMHVLDNFKKWTYRTNESGLSENFIFCLIDNILTASPFYDIFTLLKIYSLFEIHGN